MTDENQPKGSTLKGFIDALKKSSFSQFLQKIHSKNNIFEYSKENKKTTIMCNIDRPTLKLTILQFATTLIALHGKTTNLDIKNLVHNAKPGCELTQAEVSDIMNELYNEGKFNRENLTTGGDYWNYSAIDTVDTVTDADVVDDTTTVATQPVALPASQPAQPLSNVSVQPGGTIKSVTPAPATTPSTPSTPLSGLNMQLIKGLNIQAIAQKDDGKGAIKLGKIGNQSATFLSKLDGDLRVGFDAKDAGDFEKYVLTDTKDMFEARNMMKFALGVKHNDCRSIRLETYLKRAGIVPAV